MRALLDLDVYAYRTSVGLDNEPTPDLAIERCTSLIADTIRDLGVDSYQGFLSPGRSSNFRRLLWPDYKANRTQPNPRWLQATKDYLVREKGAVQCEFYEADDALGYSQTEDTIICSIDKDLLTIPGEHYNFVKKERSSVSRYAAEFNFWKQMITGDRSDNVQGITGLGEVKATRILQQVPREEWCGYIKDLYDNPTRFVLSYNLLRIWTEPLMLYYNDSAPTGSFTSGDGRDNVMPTKEDFLKKLQELSEEFKTLLKTPPKDES